MSVADNIAHLRERIAAAARRAHRNPAEIQLMAVTKTVAPTRIREAYVADIRCFGENRVQEFAAKKNSLNDVAECEWHLIGHLQTNKAAQAVELFDAADSLDSLRLAEKLNSVAEKLNRRLPDLLQIN